MPVVPEREWAAVQSLRLGGRSFEFYRREATVLERQRWSETHISSSGGGGYLDKGSGVVRAAQVHSHVEDRAEYWVRLDDGIEVDLQVSGDLRCRPGQQLTLISAIPKGIERGPFLLAYNHQTREFSQIHSQYGWFVKEYRIGANQWLWWLGTALALTLAAPVLSLAMSGVPLSKAVAAAVADPSPTAMKVGAVIGLVVGLFMTQVVLVAINLPRIKRLQRHLTKIGRLLQRNG